LRLFFFFGLSLGRASFVLSQVVLTVPTGFRRFLVPRLRPPLLPPTSSILRGGLLPIFRCFFLFGLFHYAFFFFLVDHNPYGFPTLSPFSPLWSFFLDARRLSLSKCPLPALCPPSRSRETPDRRGVCSLTPPFGECGLFSVVMSLRCFLSPISLPSRFFSFSGRLTLFLEKHPGLVSPFSEPFFLFSPCLSCPHPGIEFFWGGFCP